MCIRDSGHQVSNRTVPVKLACSNVRTMLRAGKPENIKQEMKRLKISNLGISETRWPEDNDLWSDELRVINSSSASGQGGVAIILDQTTAHTIGKICSEATDWWWLLDKETEGKDYTFVTTHWNDVFGEGNEDMFIGHYGLGYMNDRGEKRGVLQT